MFNLKVLNTEGFGLALDLNASASGPGGPFLERTGGSLSPNNDCAALIQATLQGAQVCGAQQRPPLGPIRARAACGADIYLWQ